MTVIDRLKAMLPPEASTKLVSASEAVASAEINPIEPIFDHNKDVTRLHFRRMGLADVVVLEEAWREGDTLATLALIALLSGLTAGQVLRLSADDVDAFEMAAFGDGDMPGFFSKADIRCLKKARDAAINDLLLASASERLSSGRATGGSAQGS